MGCIPSKHSVRETDGTYPEKKRVKQKKIKYKNPTREQVPSPSRASTSSLPPWVTRHDKPYTDQEKGDDDYAE
ncbi:hypothetical protein NP233_g1238 [Leucocoprinus birnbaumii]|uniref:Uncharacterized protein n=1 Tax=Leucocoprinus birnbaumii TaxID=56174 RepID=A0AAD5W0B1_9AGAR|nr:hypothetical protein NP233_g1238 [Leucocoprinus birnbaumii]